MKRILPLDGVRAVAFLIIFLRHGFEIPLLWAGVDIFFVLSGFLITSLLMEARGKPDAWGHFYERRALRILPPLILTLILATYLFQLHWGKNILWYALFAMNFAEVFHRGAPGLGILWSLAVEEQFYLFWPIVALRFAPRTVMKVAIVLMVLAPVARGIATPFLPGHWAIYYLMPFRMDLLASGALMAVLWRERGFGAAWARWGLGLMFGGVVVFAVLAKSVHGFRALDNTVVFNVFGYSLICCIAAGLIAFTLGSNKGWWVTVMAAKPVRWIGLISYTAYLVHAGAIGLITPFSSHAGNVALAFLVTIAYAWASWQLMEKPILRLSPGSWIRQHMKKAVLVG